MNKLMILLLLGMAGCGAADEDWQAKAMTDAQEMVRAQVKDPDLRFSRVQYTGDRTSGQTCGYYITASGYGGDKTNRFIVYIDGANGMNPFTDSSATPYPLNKLDFQLNWRTQCVELGYKE